MRREAKMKMAVTSPERVHVSPTIFSALQYTVTLITKKKKKKYKNTRQLGSYISTATQTQGGLMIKMGQLQSKSQSSRAQDNDF